MNRSILRQPSMSFDIPSQAVGRVTKIRDLLGRAIGEMHADRKRNSSKSPLPFKRSSDYSSQAEGIQQILGNLKKGYLMTKHSQNAKPKIKFVYLSQDDRYICWKSVDKENEKRIQIIDIEKVIKEGVEFQLTANTVQDIKRCIVIVGGGKKLQLQAAKEIDCQYFRYELNRVIKYWKGMSLNYKYNKSY